jgi:dienelactone hydrolase
LPAAPQAGPFVDPRRIAVMGFSAGGNAVLSAVDQRDLALSAERDGGTFTALADHFAD